jgi:hypothetical protein
MVPKEYTVIVVGDFKIEIESASCRPRYVHLHIGGSVHRLNWTQWECFVEMINAVTK